MASVGSSSPTRRFQQTVEGEDMEVFEAANKLQADGKSTFLPRHLLSKLSENQIVTLSGAASGFLAGVAVCPLDVVKTRLQAKGNLEPSASHTASYGKFLGQFKTILTEEGVRGLYRGLVPVVIGYLPTWTIYFTVYERTKAFYPQFLDQHFGIRAYSAIHFCSAITAGMVSSIAINPIWVVKTRLMIQTGKGKTIYDKQNALLGSAKRTYYKGTLDAFRKMYKEEGVGVFYSGLVPSIFGLVHVGIHFPVYEKLKQLLNCTDAAKSKVADHRSQVSILWRLIFASSVSKMIASTITYPHEILRTRLQLQASEDSPSSDMKRKHKSQNQGNRLIESIVSIYRKEGFKGFYTGYVINLIRTVPASAVTLVSFEYFKSYLLKLSNS
ncbi:uncharacterized protein PRCAT00005445001 [Priceomyces carsonii]|uniref:uncharacterized protein n=1 Tax=Priceomyces carsonii TaxID=28549 RepID=UPI002EDA2CEA|nr:unnamed protein product [Priceomyces carsonii]